MNIDFKNKVDKLHSRCNDIISCTPIRRKQIQQVPERGIYLFIENGCPIYVGRSNRMRARLLEHGRGSSGHNDASFAFKLARIDAKISGVNTERARAELCRCGLFAPFFVAAKKRVAEMDIKYIQVEDSIDQYLSELYIALELRTPHNDFENH